MADVAPARRYGVAFDEVAAEYDRHRPSYPDELVDHACRVAGIGSGDLVLEVGCGTGQLTRSLAARGLHVVALDRGERLISLAERNLAGRGQIKFVSARFEEAQLPPGEFRAVFSAAAFQWIDPSVGWEKVARLLAPRGTLALLQFCGLPAQPGVDDHEALLSALGRTAPEIAATWPVYRDVPAIVTGVQRRRENISEVWAWIGSHDSAQARAGEWFGDVQVACAPAVVEHSARELNGLLRTTSFYSRLPPDRRAELERETVSIYTRLGRPIRSSIVAVLVTARRR
jgi:SAM-dependent methyltransferase